MKKLLLFLAMIGWLGARAQNTSTYGTISAGASACTLTNCVYYQLPPNSPWVIATLTGAWTGTLNVYAVSDPTATYQNLNSKSWTQVASVTSNSVLSVAAAGALFVVVDAPSPFTGAATVNLSSSTTGAPLLNPAFQGQVTTTGVTATTGGSTAQCWTTAGGTAGCSSSSLTIDNFLAAAGGVDNGAAANLAQLSVGYRAYNATTKQYSGQGCVVSGNCFYPTVNILSCGNGDHAWLSTFHLQAPNHFENCSLNLQPNYGLTDMFGVAGVAGGPTIASNATCAIGGTSCTLDPTSTLGAVVSTPGVGMTVANTTSQYIPVSVSVCGASTPGVINARVLSATRLDIEWSYPPVGVSTPCTAFISVSGTGGSTAPVIEVSNQGAFAPAAGMTISDFGAWFGKDNAVRSVTSTSITPQRPPNLQIAGQTFANSPYVCSVNHFHNLATGFHPVDLGSGAPATPYIPTGTTISSLSSSYTFNGTVTAGSQIVTFDSGSAPAGFLQGIMLVNATYVTPGTTVLTYATGATSFRMSAVPILGSGTADVTFTVPNACGPIYGRGFTLSANATTTSTMPAGTAGMIKGLATINFASGDTGTTVVRMHAWQPAVDVLGNQQAKIMTEGQNEGAVIRNIEMHDSTWDAAAGYNLANGFYPSGNDYSQVLGRGVLGWGGIQLSGNDQTQLDSIQMDHLNGPGIEDGGKDVTNPLFVQNGSVPAQVAGVARDQKWSKIKCTYCGNPYTAQAAFSIETPYQGDATGQDDNNDTACENCDITQPYGPGLVLGCYNPVDYSSGSACTRYFYFTPEAHIETVTHSPNEMERALPYSDIDIENGSGLYFSGTLVGGGSGDGVIENHGNGHLQFPEGAIQQGGGGRPYQVSVTNGSTTVNYCPSNTGVVSGFPPDGTLDDQGVEIIDTTVSAGAICSSTTACPNYVSTPNGVAGNGQSLTLQYAYQGATQACTGSFNPNSPTGVTLTIMQPVFKILNLVAANAYGDFHVSDTTTKGDPSTIAQNLLGITNNLEEYVLANQTASYYDISGYLGNYYFSAANEAGGVLNTYDAITGDHSPITATCGALNPGTECDISVGGSNPTGSNGAAHFAYVPANSSLSTPPYACLFLTGGFTDSVSTPTECNLMLPASGAYINNVASGTSGFVLDAQDNNTSGIGQNAWKFTRTTTQVGGVESAYFGDGSGHAAYVGHSVGINVAVGTTSGSSTVTLSNTSLVPTSGAGITGSGIPLNSGAPCPISSIVQDVSFSIAPCVASATATVTGNIGIISGTGFSETGAEQFGSSTFPNALQVINSSSFNFSPGTVVANNGLFAHGASTFSAGNTANPVLTLENATDPGTSALYVNLTDNGVSSCLGMDVNSSSPTTNPAWITFGDSCISNWYLAVGVSANSPYPTGETYIGSSAVPTGGVIVGTASNTFNPLLVQDTNSAGRGTAGFQALNLNSSANPEFIWGGVGASGGGETSGNYQDWNISEYNYGVSNAANKSCFGSLENRTAICVNNSTGAATLPALATFNAGISLVSGPLYAAGSGGVLGQVLTSQGGSSPAWAYRFASFACTGAFASGATTASFYGLGGSATACNNTEGNSGYMMRGAGTLSKLKMRCGTTGINAASGAFTLYDAPAGTASSGGTSTGITVTYGLTPANSTLTDNTHTYTYADGDMIQIKGTTYATGETLADCSISFEY